jgi:predicted GIY-YIG superfamily endonuclease
MGAVFATVSGMEINWGICQQDADHILAEGLHALRLQPLVSHNQVVSNRAGVYLVSLEGVPLYIGEAKNLTHRIRQQFTPKTSTFYKSFLKEYDGDDAFAGVGIDDFQIQHMDVSLGRKDLEEFGIVNVPTRLNKFRVGKRNRVSRAEIDSVWREVEMLTEELLPQGEQALLGRASAPWYSAVAPPADLGIYLIRWSGSEEILYIGESTELKKRFQTHSGRTYFSALRRHIGTDMLGFELKTVKGKKRYFAPEEDEGVDAFLGECRITFLPVGFGRAELEEYAIGKHRPILNRKDKLLPTKVS